MRRAPAQTLRLFGTAARRHRMGVDDVARGTRTECDETPRSTAPHEVEAGE
jgi:hypothetical protein